MLDKQIRFEGTSGQSEYKQHFEDTAASHPSIFKTSFVPIKLFSDDPNVKRLCVVSKFTAIFFSQV